METLTRESSLTNVEKQTKEDCLNEELIQREDIKDSPFQIITVDNKSFGVMGKYRLTEEKETKDEIRKDLESITWNRIIQVIMILDQINGDKKNNKQ